MAYDATKPPNNGSLVSADVRENFRALKEDQIVDAGTFKGDSTISVAKGGSGRVSATAYGVICGGTTSTGAHQSIASVGTSGQVLTSNGAGALPTFENILGANSIGQSEIYEAAHEASSTIGAGGYANTVLNGGLYILGWQTKASSALQHYMYFVYGASNTTYATYVGMYNPAGSSNTLYFNHQYISASPPYNLGDGDVPLFVFLQVENGSGVIKGVSVSPDPPWAYNGPTNIKPHYIDRATGKKYRRIAKGLPVDWKAKMRGAGPQRDNVLAKIAAFKADPVANGELVEITQAMKQADMPLIPHPFETKAGHSIVLVDPVSAMAEKLLLLHEQGESICSLFHEDYLRIDSAVIDGRATPPGVAAHAGKWKLT